MRIVLMAAVLVGGAAVWGFAQQPPPAGPDMMKMHEQMMAQMKAGDVALDALVTQMHAATGGAKVDAMAAALTELVRQQKAMHEHMGHMHGQMMGSGMRGGRGMMRGQ